MEDDLMRRFGSDNMKAMMDRINMDDDKPLESQMISRAVESSQKRVEGNNFDARKNVLAYDDVLREQREINYQQRYEVIDSDDLTDIIMKMIGTVVDEMVTGHTQDDDTELWDLKAIIEYVHANLMDPIEIKKAD